MQINNIEGMTLEEIKYEIDRGGKFVHYMYTVSILVMTFKRPTDIYFIKGGESAAVKGLSYTLITFLLGWWGIPWGPIYSIQSLYYNLGGGKNITEAVMTDLYRQVNRAAPVSADTTADA
jgi:hypothetical protein